MTDTYRTVNPATGEVLREFPHATDEAVAAAVDGAARRYRAWRSGPVGERTAVLAGAAAAYRERVDELAALVATEMGKPVAQARGELAITADIYDYYAEHAEEFLADRPLPVTGRGSALVRLEPTGVILGIMPWNYPHYQVARFAAPNIALGNTVLVKHAPNCPQSALAVQEILAGAGLPEGAYTNLFAGIDQIPGVIADPRVQGVSLTGSERAGAAVAELAGRNLKKVVLELGGNDAFIVLDDHDLDTTIRAAVTSRMSNAGQACNSPKRYIVLDGVYDRFVAGVAEQLESIEGGDPLQAGTRLGPVSSAAARAEILAQVDDAASHGATVLRRDGVVPERGSFVAPTLLTGVVPGMRAWSEEIFGPVAIAHRVSDVDEAIELANDSPYGLSAAVFGADPELTRYVAERLEVGMVHLNGTSGTQAELPFGGVKRSGFGRELGPAGIEEFANRKLIRTF